MVIDSDSLFEAYALAPENVRRLARSLGIQKPEGLTRFQLVHRTLRAMARSRTSCHAKSHGAPVRPPREL